MSKNLLKTLSAFRIEMHNRGLNAFIIPSSDPHLSEYPADHWKVREWISGFNGSFGTVVIVEESAALFTDSRYFLQATDQLAGSGIGLVKMGLPDSPSIAEWIVERLHEGAVVGVDPWVNAASETEKLRMDLASWGISLRYCPNIVDSLWNERPPLPLDGCYVLSEKVTGQSSSSKIVHLQQLLAAKYCDYLLVTALDEIAWIFNLRGNDVEYNPVTTAYALIPKKGKALLFIDPRKVNVEITQYLQNEGVLFADYSKIESYLMHLPEQTRMMLDCSKVNCALWKAASTHCTIIDSISPANELKAIKNPIELEGYRKAMRKDGVALVRFYHWLEERVGKERITEYTIGEKLRYYRSLQENFVGESFGTIAGYKAHGAVVHYSPTPESAYEIEPDGLLLIDSGGQYFNGTTDITRTITLGNPTEAQKRDFTLVLKGNIALANAVFPQNTRGSQIDILARKALWENGLNYLHGTGHGVGHFLNVHEGPQSIRMEENSVTLKPGMVMSDEPGLYREGAYGIRTENMIVITEKETTPFGTFYQCETLTLFPIDRRLIDVSLLSAEEKEWLNNYHRKVYNALSPDLTAEEQLWLQEKTATL